VNLSSSEVSLKFKELILSAKRYCGIEFEKIKQKQEMNRRE